MKFEKTKPRGFLRYAFTDRYGVACHLQKSSLATEDAIWLGLDQVKPQLMASDAMKLGRADLVPGAIEGWVAWPMPDEVALHGVMHLTRDQVAALLPLLTFFVETGALPDLVPPATQQGALHDST